MKRLGGFTLIELMLVIGITSIFGGIVFDTVVKSYRDNRKIETQSLIQSDLNLAVDRLSRVLRSTTLIIEATQTNLKIRGYPSANDTAPSEVNFYLDGAALKYSVIPPTGSAPNYTYNQTDATYHTLLFKTTNSVSNPVFKYYTGSDSLLAFPVTIASIKAVEVNLSALDVTNILTTPTVVTTKITLRNFKTNL